MPGKRVTVGGVVFDAFTENHVVAHVREALDRGIGGRILTPNVDIVRQVRHSAFAADVAAASSIVVADGMPLVWASRLAGTPLPARVCGSDLIWSLSRGMGQDGRSIFVLGGEPAPGDPAVGRRRSDRRNAGPAHAAARERARNERTSYAGDVRSNARDGAGRAAARLTAECPGLTVAGAVSPPYGFDRDAVMVGALVDRVAAARPDLVLVGIGFPRQERLIDTLLTALPRSWFLGCGMAIGFVAGEQRRAPVWMRRAGVEWMHRLAAEPGRLAERYLRHDLPFAVSLLGKAAVERLRPGGRAMAEEPAMSALAAVWPAARRNESASLARSRLRTGLNERADTVSRPAVPSAANPTAPGTAGSSGRRHRKTRRHGR